MLWRILLSMSWLVSPALAQETLSPEIAIGSKAFTESVILGEMLTQLATHAGAHAVHRAELGGTQVLYQGLLSGDIDAYVEYTGTITAEILSSTPTRNFKEMSSVLAEQGVLVSAPLGFNNTYALGIKRERAEQLAIKTISDLKSHPELRLGFSNEFLQRQDGWPGLRRAYDLPKSSPLGMDHALAYRALNSGSLDATDLYSTDPEIKAHNLLVLEDDLDYFPSYEAVVLYRDDLATRAPRVLDSLLKLEGVLSEDEMVALNAQVLIERQTERSVAAHFLQSKIDPGIEPPLGGRQQDVRRGLLRFLRNTRDHLFMVGVSLIGAIFVSVPLGILAYQYPKWGRLILTVTGIIQTLPSLAILVFMIPLLGLGTWPAIVALFLYSLLPIVRNTVTGLRDIPQSIHESALALGLPAKARLIKIELPLAARSILAGIKTAAVINVGTATIGALIGAGGYGQPILTGIRLLDYSLILQGAIPAALLAILVEQAFHRIEAHLTASK